jgi:hypothetical protein
MLTAKKLFSDPSSYLQTRLSCTEQGYHDVTQLVSMRQTPVQVARDPRSKMHQLGRTMYRMGPATIPRRFERLVRLTGRSEV